MPYRISQQDAGDGVSVMLVTSRETKRWVLPKGNQISGLPPHASAAHEAEEEAGVIGAACPTSIGHYRYRKRRRNGASLMLDVEVFPIAVTTELDEWDEQEERERRWFTLAEAANAVDEPDLQQIIRNFKASENASASQHGILPVDIQELKKGFHLFHWFQSLLLRPGHFFDLFEAHAKTLTAGSDALVRLLQGGSGMADHIKGIVEREHEADNISREMLQNVRRAFFTPFNRSAIVSLIGSMDDAIDRMQQTAGAIDLYEVKDFDQEMRDMAAIIVDAARITAEALPLLRKINANAVRLHELTERLVQIEGQADLIHAQGLSRLFKEHGARNTIRFIIFREIYGHLEKVVDRFEDVANEIDGLVIDHG